MKKTKEELIEEFKTIAGENVTSDESIAFLEDKNVTSLEGYLFPTTYHFELEMDERQIITKMLKTFVSNLPENWESVLQKKTYESARSGNDGFSGGEGSYGR